MKTNKESNLKPVKFTVLVNAFTREAKISAIINGCEYVRNQTFKDIDEWNAFEMENRTFDIHYHYDKEFTVSIYDVINGTAQTVGNRNKVKLKIILKDLP